MRVPAFPGPVARKDMTMTCAGKTVTIDGKVYRLTEAGDELSKDIVIVRTDRAGVHVGKVAKHDGQTVKLTSARRVWRWKGANTLNELSQVGADMEYTRISEPVAEIMLLDAIEILPCTEAAAKNLTVSRWPT